MRNHNMKRIMTSQLPQRPQLLFNPQLTSLVFLVQKALKVNTVSPTTVLADMI